MRIANWLICFWFNIMIICTDINHRIFRHSKLDMLSFLNFKWCRNISHGIFNVVLSDTWCQLWMFWWCLSVFLRSPIMGVVMRVLWPGWDDVRTPCQSQEWRLMIMTSVASLCHHHHALDVIIPHSSWQLASLSRLPAPDKMWSPDWVVMMVIAHWLIISQIFNNPQESAVSPWRQECRALSSAEWRDLLNSCDYKCSIAPK